MEDINQAMSIAEQEEAKRLYGEWFKYYPDIKNPSDINSKFKFDHVMGIGWEKLKLMQKARKLNVSRFGYPFDWTKSDYWKERNNGQ